jgi:hypothetical protein
MPALYLVGTELGSQCIMFPGSVQLWDTDLYNCSVVVLLRLTERKSCILFNDSPGIAEHFDVRGVLK